jgi:hypothetical protein
MYTPANLAKHRIINSLKGPRGLGLVPKRGSNPLPFECFAQEINEYCTPTTKHEPTTNFKYEPVLK